MIQRKKTVLTITAIAMLILIGLGIANARKSQIEPAQIDTARFPTEGNVEAKVDLLLFEDLCCSGCQFFDQIIYPQLFNQYIQTGKVRYTVVPLAFLDHSKTRANAAWAVYMQDPNRFFLYIHELYRYNMNEEMGREVLLEVAEKVGGIDLEKLDHCIQTNCYYAALDQNLVWAQKVMKKNFGTPALFINGERASVRNFETIQNEIERSIDSP